MDKVQKQVREFHIKYGVPTHNVPQFPEPRRAMLRIDLIEEEFEEFQEAIYSRNLTGVADALADLLYVTYGAALEFGLDMEPIMDEVQRSNMSKLGADGLPIYSENGKVLKGPNFTPPDIQGEIAKQCL